MVQGSNLAFYTENADVYDFEENHLNGLFLESTVPGWLNTITWIDTEQNIQFAINAAFDYMDILHMAENVCLYKTTK